MNIVFDEEDFEHTAKAVLEMNPHLVKDFYTQNWKFLKHELQRCADLYLRDNSHFNMCGAAMSAYTKNGTRYITAHPSAMMVTEYLRTIGKL